MAWWNEASGRAQAAIARCRRRLARIPAIDIAVATSRIIVPNTLIPAAGDFINVDFVGTDSKPMIGNIIEKNFLKPDLRPQMAAISFVLMALILIGVFGYARALGTEDLA